MTSLPVCNYWIFSRTGLLLEDWLLRPSRPVDLTNSWRQTALHSSYTENRDVHNISNETLQIVVYFAFPLLPVLSVLIALANIMHEAKNYMCPRKHLACRPYGTRLSHSLMVFFVLAAITSSLTWIGSLMRYIPMSPYADPDGGVRKSPNAAGTAHNQTDSSSDSTQPMHGTHFVAQLPAILTMQAVLRLTLIWITLGLITERICVLNRLIRNPIDSRVQVYLHSIHQLFQLHCNSEVCPMREINIDVGCTERNDSMIIPNGFNSRELDTSRGCGGTVSKTVRRYINQFCCVPNMEPECCYGCSQNVRRWSHPHVYDAWQRNHQKQSTASRRTHGSCLTLPSETTRSVGQTFMSAAFLICIALAVCLPQLWAYQLTRNDLNLSLDFEPLEHQGTFITWRLTNRTGKALYEYGLAIVSFVIPGCLLLVSMLLLVTKVSIAARRLTRKLQRNLAMEDNFDVTAHRYLIKYCVNCLNRDSLLIIALGMNYLLCWMPQATTTTVHRLTCLLNVDDGEMFNNMNQNTWPNQLGWLWIELITLLGDLLAQIMLFLIRICEPVWTTPNLMDQDESLLSEDPEVGNDDEDDEVEDFAKDDKEMQKGTYAHQQSVRSSFTSRANAMPTQPTEPRIAHPFRAPSDDGKTSQNISPLPISHTLSETIHPNGQTRGSGRRYPQLIPRQIRSCRSNPSPYPSPLIARLPGRSLHGEPNSLQLHQTPLSYNEPRNSTVLLTYSPRSRHPCRTRPENKSYQHSPAPNTPNSHCSYWPSHPSPPPLPPPPRHLTSMIGDSSIYSTPHGSPKEQASRAVSNANVNCTSPSSYHVQFAHPDDCESVDLDLVRDTEQPCNNQAVAFHFAQHPHYIHDVPYSPVFS